MKETAVLGREWHYVATADTDIIGTCGRAPITELSVSRTFQKHILTSVTIVLDDNIPFFILLPKSLKGLFERLPNLFCGCSTRDREKRKPRTSSHIPNRPMQSF
jgi:hypothetical protein